MRRDIAPPKRISDYGGLEAYLDETKDKHNGLSYKDFVSRVRETRKHPVPSTVIAEDFGVSRVTVYSWKRIYKKEQVAKVAKSSSPDRL